MKPPSSTTGSTSIGIIWWLLGLATTIAMSGGSVWLTSIDAQTKRISEKAEMQAERLGKVETEQRNRWEETQRRLEKIEAKQDRVEVKIDRLLQNSNDHRRMAEDN